MIHPFFHRCHGNAQRAALSVVGTFTHMTKGNNPMKDVYDAKFLRVWIHVHFIGFVGAITERYNARFRIALQSNITFF